MFSIDKEIASIESSKEPVWHIDAEDLLPLLKLVKAQHAIIAQLNHHSEFAGDHDIVDAINAYDELTGEVTE